MCFLLLLFLLLLLPLPPSVPISFSLFKRLDHFLGQPWCVLLFLLFFYSYFSDKMLTNDNLSSQNNGDTISVASTDSRPASASTTQLDLKGGWVLLNVGGKHFMTTRSTLSKEESFLCRLCQCEPDLKTDVVRSNRLIDRFLILLFRMKRERI